MTPVTVHIPTHFQVCLGFCIIHWVYSPPIPTPSGWWACPATSATGNSRLDPPTWFARSFAVQDAVERAKLKDRSKLRSEDSREVSGLSLSTVQGDDQLASTEESHGKWNMDI